MTFKESEKKMCEDIKKIGEKLYPNEKVTPKLENGKMHVYTNITNTNSCDKNFDILGYCDDTNEFYKITNFYVKNKSCGKSQEILDIIIDFCKYNSIPKLVITMPNEYMIKFLVKNSFIKSETRKNAYEFIII